MPFPLELSKAVDAYALNDLPGELEWHVQFFDFLGDAPRLQQRLGREFFSARYVYKIMEGLHGFAKWVTQTQVRLQVLQYASIFEAALHHLLFNTLRQTPAVKDLLHCESLKKYSVPQRLAAQYGHLAEQSHDGKTIVPAFFAKTRIPDTAVRFENKVDAAMKLGLVKPFLGADLQSIYEARNSIHIHAELRRRREWAIELSSLAYRRMQPFRKQVWTYLNS